MRVFSFIPALVALGGVTALALFPDPNKLSGVNMGPDRVALWFLVVCAAIAQTPALFVRLKGSRYASTWALLCAFFVLFHLADRAGPSEGFSLRFPFAPDDPVVISYAARAVILGALISMMLGGWAWLRRGGPEKAILAGLGLVGLLGVGTLFLLGNTYPIGADKTLVPGPMANLLAQILSYGALALCCRAVTEREETRGLVLRLLPLTLLGVALRHQFQPTAAPPDDE